MSYLGQKRFVMSMNGLIIVVNIVKRINAALVNLCTLNISTLRVAIILTTCVLPALIAI